LFPPLLAGCIEEAFTVNVSVYGKRGDDEKRALFGLDDRDVTRLAGDAAMSIPFPIPSCGIRDT